jgi:hypothetical protein
MSAKLKTIQISKSDKSRFLIQIVDPLVNQRCFFYCTKDSLNDILDSNL